MLRRHCPLLHRIQCQIAVVLMWDWLLRLVYLMSTGLPWMEDGRTRYDIPVVVHLVGSSGLTANGFCAKNKVFIFFKNLRRCCLGRLISRVRAHPPPVIGGAASGTGRTWHESTNAPSMGLLDRYRGFRRSPKQPKRTSVAFHVSTIGTFVLVHA